jgi:HAE1 family hydrophobic/amphiphilic exporter-1
MLDDQREVVIRAAGEFRSLEDISSTVVTYRQGRPIYVRDLGEVADSFEDVKSELWIDGKPGIRLRIAKQSGANTVEVVNSLREEIDSINAEYEGRLRLTVLMDSSEFIKQAVTNVQSAALYGALLALVVLMIFLRDWRSTLVISTAIPISVLATFALMYFYGFTLNVISFGGLALGIGMLVDSAIVVLENIYRKRELKMGHSEAAVQGSREVAAAVIAGTVTTVTVFFPVLFMPGFAGIFFKEMAVVVCFALTCSLTVALMLIPMLSAKVLRKQPGQSRASLSGKLYAAGETSLKALEKVYGILVRTALRSPVVTVLLALIVLLCSSALVPVVGYELMPEADEGQLNISVKLPIGTPLERTIQVMQDMEQRVLGLLDEGELEHVMTVAGPARSWRPGTANQGSLELALVPVSRRQRTVEQIAGVLRPELARLPGTEFQVRPSSSNILMWIMRGGGDRLSVDIRGHDLRMSALLADQVAEVMKSIEGVADVDIAREPGKMERVVQADRERLAELGLGGSDMAEAVEHYVLGKVSTRYREEGYEYDVRVQLHPRDREHIQQLPHLPIISAEGRLVPLASVSEIAKTESPTSITREDQERILKVNAGIADRSLGDIVKDLQPVLAKIVVPEGFSVAVGGEYLEQQKMFGDLLVGLLIAVFLVYAVLVVQFESLLHPLVIMTAVPFGFIGVVLSLYLTGTTFNINSFLGSIVLVGIMVNNSIVLVDYVNLLRREHKMNIYEALVEGARRRLRPVLMTTTTTVLAMFPLAMGLGEGSELQAPLARVIVGGLITSTLITLVFVPSLYFLIERRRAAVPATEDVTLPASVRLAD